MDEELAAPVSQILALTAYLTALTATLRAADILPDEAINGIAALAIGALPPDAREVGEAVIETITFRSADLARMISVS